jgi:hypothetical protein
MPGQIAVGEFQLEGAQRSRSWRGRGHGGRHCAVADITTTEAQINCSLDIMTDQLRGAYDRRNPGPTGNSYWEKLKTNRTSSRWESSPIIRSMTQFDGCNTSRDYAQRGRELDGAGQRRGVRAAPRR